ncbi:hypothetical protein D3C73_1544330 [compost metagenome]
MAIMKAYSATCMAAANQSFQLRGAEGRDVKNRASRRAQTSRKTDRPSMKCHALSASRGSLPRG